jgi:hypothetical protein
MERLYGAILRKELLSWKTNSCHHRVQIQIIYYLMNVTTLLKTQAERGR